MQPYMMVLAGSEKKKTVWPCDMQVGRREGEEKEWSYDIMPVE